MQLKSDCFGEIQCRPRNLKRQCIPDGPQVSFIVTSVESVWRVGVQEDGLQIVASNSNGLSFSENGRHSAAATFEAVANSLSKHWETTFARMSIICQPNLS
jgi:hypothetical protein